MPIIRMLMHWEQLDGGDTKRLEVLDNRRRCQACIRAAQLVWYLGVQFREPFDVQFVNNRVLKPQRIRGTPLSRQSGFPSCFRTTAFSFKRLRRLPSAGPLIPCLFFRQMRLRTSKTCAGISWGRSST